MNLANLDRASVVTLASVVVTAALGLLTTFGVIHFDSDQKAAVLNVCVFGTSSGLLVYAWLHSWSTATYDVANISAGLVSAANTLLAFLNAFNIFHATAVQRDSLTAVCGAMALVGAYVFAALHTQRKLMLRRAAMQTHGAETRKLR